MTETERLLAQAREICLRVHDAAPDELVLAVFARLCGEQDLAQAEAMGEGARH